MNQVRGWQAMTLLIIIVFLYLFKIVLYDDIKHLASTIYSKQASHSVAALTETDMEFNLLKRQYNELMMQNKAIPQVSVVSSVTELLESLSQMVVDKNLMMSSIEHLTTKQQDNFIEYSFMLQLIGTYKNNGLLIQSIENTFPLTRFEKVDLKPNTIDGIDVVLQLVIYSIRQ